MATKRKASNELTQERRVRRRISEAPSLGFSIAAVLVGPAPPRGFSPHKAILERHSDFCKTALAEARRASRRSLLSLPETDVEAFEMFYGFIYRGGIFCQKDGDYQATNEFPGATATDAEWARLGDAWITGDRLLSTSFKDAVIDAMIAKVVDTGTSPVELHQVLYPKSSTDSPIRRLLVDMAIWDWGPGTMQTRAQIPDSSTFFFDVAVAMDSIKVSGRAKVAPYAKENTCAYHEHGDNKPCYKTMQF